MERLPKFIKKVAKLAVISSIGLVPGQLKGQEVINNTEHQIRIENNEQLKSQIFNEVKVAFENGVLKNTQQNAYFFRLEKDGYDITYDFDADYDEKKEISPTIEIDYTDGNSNYILQEGPSEITNRDIVYNYKDNLLSNSETKMYGDFFAENRIIIRNLYGKNDSPVYSRKINKEEMVKFLKDIKQFAQVVDSVGINKNNKNLQQKEEKIKLEQQKEKEERDMIKISENLLDSLKNKQKLEGGEYNEYAMSNISHGIYSYKYYGQNIDISFVDSDGYTNEVSVDVGKKQIRRARKYNKIESNLKIIDLSNTEAKKVVENAFLEINK